MSDYLCRGHLCGVGVDMNFIVQSSRERFREQVTNVAEKRINQEGHSINYEEFQVYSRNAWLRILAKLVFQLDHFVSKSSAEDPCSPECVRNETSGKPRSIVK